MPVQVRDALAAARQRGLTFDEAWTWAIGERRARPVQFPHASEERWDWRAALDATREEWRAAYEGRPSAVSAQLALLLSRLMEDPETDASRAGIPRGVQVAQLAQAPLPTPRSHEPYERAAA